MRFWRDEKGGRQLAWLLGGGDGSLRGAGLRCWRGLLGGCDGAVGGGCSKVVCGQKRVEVLCRV